MAQKETQQPFIALADYKTPSLPVVEGLQATWLGWKELRRRDEQEPLIKDDRLRGVTTERLDQVAAPPACGPVIDELALSFNTWLEDHETSERLQTVVLPPCEKSGVVRAWAKEQGCEVLEPPRAALLAARSCYPQRAANAH